MTNPDFEEQPLVLVVDDEKTARLVMRRAMERERYRVALASDGKEGMEASLQLKPDIILLDAMMPVMDGFTCCSALQDLLGQDCPPILMITALEDEASVDRAFEVGAIDYVTKPIHWPVLRQRVRRILAERWAWTELYQTKEKLEVANRQLQRLACMDGLTGLHNRRHFDEYLHREWKRLMREKAPLSLILCDIDFFKAYNDTYGHQAGDECIRRVAEILHQCARRSADLAARYGGEEFALILPNTEAIGAVQIAETIRSRIKARGISHVGSQVSQFLTLSLGVASLIPNRHCSADILIRESDKALYKAKRTGRDRVVCHSLDLHFNDTAKVS
ncbi:MAG: PleD family two-component system response regulator [Oscillatoria sp. SIO1A7]|nr:PleD family two-component system response regulator [Oscillatoria sp. SIO1A7]